MTIYCPLAEALGIETNVSILDIEDNHVYNDKILGSFTGQKHSEESKKIMSERAKNRPNIWIGRKHSEESKYKMSQSHMGKTGFWKGKQFSEEARKNMSIANHLRPVFTCPHCGKVAKAGPSKRWHFDNCRYKNGQTTV